MGEQSLASPADPLEHHSGQKGPPGRVDATHSLPGTAREAAENLWLSPRPLAPLPALPLTWANLQKPVIPAVTWEHRLAELTTALLQGSDAAWPSTASNKKALRRPPSSL